MINPLIATFCGLPVEDIPRPVLVVTKNADGSYNWTEETDAALKKLLEDGWSINEIARCSFMSYSSIQSRVHRITGKRKKREKHGQCGSE